MGVRALMFDLDNTLARWNSFDVVPGLRKWLDDCRARGFAVCICSNNHAPRVRPVAEALGMDYIADAGKPASAAYRRACRLLNAAPECVAAVGDQLLTDVFGAKRNGLRAVLKKGFYESVASLDADVVCLQETKMQKEQADFDFPGYFEYWNSATTRKGYSGTAIFSKKEPLSVTCGMGLEEFDREGRVIAAEYEDFILVTVYTPNSQRTWCASATACSLRTPSGSTSLPCGRRSPSSSAGT